MITIIKGTKSSQDVLLRAAAAVAGASGIVFHKKTLVMQVADNLPDIEFLYNGHTKESESTVFGNLEINTEEYGMDSLLIRAEAGRVTREQFASLVDNVSTAEEELDVAPRTMTADFESTVVANADAFAALLRYAAGTTMSNAVYDNCVVVISGLNEDVVNICRSVADVCVTVVTPGRAQIGKDTTKGNGKDKKRDNKGIVDMVLVYDYEHDSIYNAANLKTAYGTKNLAGIPHNFLYNDACEQGTAYNFLVNNLADEETDYSYGFISAVKGYTEGVYKHGLKQEETYQNELEKAKLKEEKDLDKDELPDGSIDEEMYEEKQGLFGKTVEKSRFVVNMAAESEDLSSGIQFEEMEKDKGFDELAEEAEEASKKEQASLRKRNKNDRRTRKEESIAPSIVDGENIPEDMSSEDISSEEVEENDVIDKDSKEYKKSVIAREKEEIKAEKAKNKRSFFNGLFGKKPSKEELPELILAEESSDYEGDEEEREAYETDSLEEEFIETSDGDAFEESSSEEIMSEDEVEDIEAQSDDEPEETEEVEETIQEESTEETKETTDTSEISAADLLDSFL